MLIEIASSIRMFIQSDLAVNRNNIACGSIFWWGKKDMTTLRYQGIGNADRSAEAQSLCCEVCDGNVAHITKMLNVIYTLRTQNFCVGGRS